MSNTATDLTLETLRTGNRCRVTARLADAVIHVDEGNPATATFRKRFVAALIERVPAADPVALDAELLKIADTTNDTSNAPTALVEMDVSNIVRPEYFSTRELTGLSVPVVINAGGKPSPRWMQYIRWADGRRECRELVNCIDLAGASRLWIHPLPGEPAMNTVAAWSARSRAEWLNGSNAPNPAEVFRVICERIAHYIDLPAEVAPGTTATLALWSILTYGHSIWPALPYLFVGGPAGSGKSTVFAVLNQLAFRPLNSSNMTAAALFRTLHDRGGTLLLDEAERLKQSTPDVAELLSMLLAGYKRGGQATRLEAVGDTFRTVSFDVYGPKALACIAGLPAALASRCITITMFRSGPGSEKPRRRIDADTRWQLIRDDLHALALEYGSAWRELAHRTDVCPSQLAGRAFELWQPLLALASWLEEHGAVDLLPMMQCHAVEQHEGSKEEQIHDADETLLEILTEKVRAGIDPTPGEILAQAKDRDKATFDKWAPRTVSNRLNAYGLKTVKWGGKRSFRTVTLAALLRVQTNYGIDLGIPAQESCVPLRPQHAKTQ